MTITKSVCIGEIETEVSISVEDIINAIGECDPEARTFEVAKGINACAQFLKTVDDEKIAQMKTEQRKTISIFLSEQSIRFAP